MLYWTPATPRDTHITAWIMMYPVGFLPILSYVEVTGSTRPFAQWQSGRNACVIDLTMDLSKAYAHARVCACDSYFTSIASQHSSIPIMKQYRNKICPPKSFWFIESFASTRLSLASGSDLMMADPKPRLLNLELQYKPRNTNLQHYPLVVSRIWCASRAGKVKRWLGRYCVLTVISLVSQKMIERPFIWFINTTDNRNWNIKSVFTFNNIVISIETWTNATYFQIS